MGTSRLKEGPSQQSNEPTDIRFMVGQFLAEAMKKGGTVKQREENGSTTTEIDLRKQTITIIQRATGKQIEIAIKPKSLTYQDSLKRMKVDDKGRMFFPKAYNANPPTILLSRLEGTGHLELILTNDPFIRIPSGWVRTTIKQDFQSRITLPDIVPEREAAKNSYIKFIGHGSFITVTEENSADIDPSIIRELAL